MDRLLPEAPDIHAQFAKGNGDAIGGEALGDALQAVAIVESRLDFRPEVSNPGSLRRWLFLAQRGEAGPGILAHKVDFTTAVNKSQQSTTRSTIVNTIQQVARVKAADSWSGSRP